MYVFFIVNKLDEDYIVNIFEPNLSITSELVGKSKLGGVKLSHKATHTRMKA